jgi:hypothetical protein
MRSLIILFAAIVFAGILFILPDSMLWTPAWMLAPALGGAFIACILRNDHGSAREAIVYALAMGTIALATLALGVYALASLYGMGFLTLQVMVIGSLVGFGMMAFTAAFVFWLFLPSEWEIRLGSSHRKLSYKRR